MAHATFSPAHVDQRRNFKITAAMIMLFAFLMAASRSEAAPSAVARPIRTPGGVVFTTNNFPVTVCGTISATSRDADKVTYVLRNGAMEIWLKFSTAIDHVLLNQFRHLRGISPQGASGCVSGRELPFDEQGQKNFVVEAGEIAIADGIGR